MSLLPPATIRLFGAVTATRVLKVYFCACAPEVQLPEASVKHRMRDRTRNFECASRKDARQDAQFKVCFSQAQVAPSDMQLLTMFLLTIDG